MPPIPKHRKVVLARAVAARYLLEAAHPEYRLTIFLGGIEGRNVPGLLNGLRGGRLRLGGMAAPADMGVREEFDAITIWSSDESSLQRVAGWFEARGFETSGVH
jgi:hypothetical protein